MCGRKLSVCVANQSRPDRSRRHCLVLECVVDVVERGLKRLLARLATVRFDTRCTEVKSFYSFVADR